MTQSNIQIDPGTTDNLPTYTVTWNSNTTYLPASALVNSSGTELFTNSNPGSVATTNGALETGGNLATLAGTVSTGKIQANITNASIPVTGTFWQSTQPISAASLPLPSGAATSANQTTLGSQTTEINDGTNTANVVAGDTGFNGIATAGATKTYPFSTSVSGAQMLLANTPTEGFTWMTIVYTSVGSGLALTAQFSPNSGGTYVTSNSFQNGSGGIGVLGTTVNTIYNGPIYNNFFQLNVTALTSGTFSGYVTLHYGFSPLSSSIALTAGSATIGNVGSSSATGSAVPTTAFYSGYNVGGNLTGVNGQVGDGSTTAWPSGTYSWNGSAWNRAREANAASNTTGTGLLGAGTMMFDGTNWQKVSATNPLPTYTLAPTGNGFTSSHYISAASTNATNVKASAGDIGGIQAYNNGASIAYLKIYDKATSPTVGTDTPIKVIIIPANTSGAGSNVSFASPGVSCTNGIGFAITGGIADSDTTAVSANAIVVNLDTK